MLNTHVKCFGIVIPPHRTSLVCILHRLIDNLQHTHVAELVVLVNLLGHPLEKLQRPLILILLVKPWVRRILPRKRVIRRLRPRSPMQVNNNIQTRITRPPAQRLQILKPTLREMLTIPINQILLHPVTHRHADRVQPIALNLVNVLLGNPRSPVLRKGAIRRVLPDTRHAVELGFLPAAAHVRPGVLGNPGLEHE